MHAHASLILCNYLASQRWEAVNLHALWVDNDYMYMYFGLTGHKSNEHKHKQNKHDKLTPSVHIY